MLFSVSSVKSVCWQVFKHKGKQGFKESASDYLDILRIYVYHITTIEHNYYHPVCLKIKLHCANPTVFIDGVARCILTLIWVYIWTENLKKSCGKDPIFTNSPGGQDYKMIWITLPCMDLHTIPVYSYVSVYFGHWEPWAMLRIWIQSVPSFLGPPDPLNNRFGSGSLIG